MIPHEQSSNSPFSHPTPPAGSRRPHTFPLVSRSTSSESGLQQLLNSAHMELPSGCDGISVNALTTDAREVEEGALFVCRGEGALARQEIEEALRRGASAVVGGVGPLTSVPSYLRVEDPRQVLGALSSAFHRHPSRALRCCAVAGGLGKTTSAAFLQEFLEVNGRRCGLVSSLGHQTGLASYLPYNTTPGVERVHGLLREMCEAQRDAAIIELSRHALREGRADAVNFEVALITNTTGIEDEEEFETLVDLVRALPSGAVAVLNRDDEAFEILAAACDVPVMSFGVQRGGEIAGRILRTDAQGTVIEVRIPGGRFRVRSSSIGHHHVENVVGAIAAAIAMGVDPDHAAERMHRVGSVPGRLERVPHPGCTVLLDAAASPPALARALGDIRPLVDGRLWVIVGACAQDDDQDRARLAEVAEAWADTVVLTSDDPGGDNPMTLIREMTKGLRRPRDVRIAQERSAAIRLALDEAGPDDLVLIARRGQGNPLPWALEGGADDRSLVEGAAKK